MQYSINDKNEIIMKMLHYFIVEKDYNPIILQGAENEIWLENLASDDYKIVRIVSDRIINEEQFNYDLFKTKKVVSKIKQKTFSLNLPVLSIFTNIDTRVKLENKKNISFVSLSSDEDLNKSDLIKNNFPDMQKKLSFNEKGAQLFMKITSDINKKNKKDAERVNNVFKNKETIITKIIIAINVVLFFLFAASSHNMSIYFGANSLAIFQNHEYWRLISSMFAHANLLHLVVNMYSLHIIGSQIESYMGRTRFLFIYLFSGMLGSLLSVAMNDLNIISVGASGAIFGLMGSLLYFGYHYRVYLSNALKSQIIPLIMINLLFGFMIEGIDNFAHIGGLIGGVSSAMAVGIQHKTSTIEKINGFIISLILTVFFISLAVTRLNS